MKLLAIIQLINENFNKPPITNQLFGSLEIMHYVDDIFSYVQKKHYPIQNIPLNKLLNNDNSLPGNSDETDNSREFRSRVNTLSLRDFQEGKYPPVLIVKQGNEWWVADGRHRILQLVYYLKAAKKNPKLYTIRGYVIDQKTVNQKILSVADKYDRDIN